jgi:NAD(P)-dependent dehydrogenase (short-subunit alcohol dehydrogenase family)
MFGHDALRVGQGAMSRSSRQRVVVITGASAGIGRATAIAFAGRGDRVALLARGAAGLEGARADIERAGGIGLPLPTDVASAASVEAAAEACEAELGPIDVWVNNAMATVFAPVAATTAEEFRRATEVTYLGVVHGTMSALRRMRPRDRGAIVQVGSALSYRGIPLQAAYCGAKHAIKGFTESLRCELFHESSGVRVSMVQLPALNTPQFDWSRSKMPRQPQPVPPIFQPEVAAQAIVWSADHGRREIHVGLPTVKAIVGEKVAPGLLDRYLGATGYDAQQTDEPSAERDGNLFQPLDEDVDHGVHGRFDDRAKPASRMLWLSRHRQAMLAAGGAAAAGAATLARRAR